MEEKENGKDAATNGKVSLLNPVPTGFWGSSWSLPGSSALYERPLFKRLSLCSGEGGEW